MASTTDAAAQKPQVPFDHFGALDMRIARVVSAPMAEGVRQPSRVVTLDLGPLGTRTSVGQYALIPEEQLVGRNLVACVNLGDRRMGRYTSQALMLGAPHPDSPMGQQQATPLFAGDEARPGDQVF